jgi:hypothetical protein
MAATPFTRPLVAGERCRACKEAGRRTLVTSLPIHKQRLPSGVQVCPFCDNVPPAGCAPQP